MGLLGDDLGSVGSLFVELRGDTSKLSKDMKSLNKRGADLTAKFKVVGAAIAGAFVGQALISGVSRPISAFADFELALTNVTNLLDGGEKFSAEFAAGVKRISVEFGQSKAALTSGLFDIVSAGTATSDALIVLEESARLANAGVTDTSVTTSALLTVMKSFGDEVRDVSDASDVLFSIQKFGRTTLAEVATGFGQVAPLASLAGLSLNDLGAALSTATLGGSSTAEVITGLQALLNSFIQPTGDATKAAKELGIELNSNALQGDNFVTTLRAIAGGSIEQQAAIAGSVRGFRALGPIVQDVGRFQDIYAGIVDRTGATQTASNKVSQTTAKQLAKLKEQFSNIAITVGGPLAKVLLNFFEGIKIIGGALTKVRSEVKLSGRAIGSLGRAAQEARGGLSLMESEIVDMTEVLRNEFDVQMVRTTNDTEAYHEQLQDAIAAAKAFGGESSNVADTLDIQLRPAITETNAATVATIALLKDLKDLYPSTYEVGRSIQEAARVTTAALAAETGNLVIELTDAKGAFEGIKAPIQQYGFEIDSVIAASKSARTAIEDSVAAQEIEWGKAQATAEIAATGMQAAIDDVRDAAGGIFDALVTAGKNPLQSLVDSKGGALSLGKAMFQDITAALAGPILNAFRDFFGKTLSGITDGFASSIGSKIGGALGVGGGAADVAGGASGVSGVGSSLASGLSGGLFTFAGSFLGTALGSLFSGQKKANGIISGSVSELRDLFKGFIDVNIPSMVTHLGQIDAWSHASRDRLRDINDNTKMVVPGLDLINDNANSLQAGIEKTNLLLEQKLADGLFNALNAILAAIERSGDRPMVVEMDGRVLMETISDLVDHGGHRLPSTQVV